MATHRFRNSEVEAHQVEGEERFKDKRGKLVVAKPHVDPKGREVKPAPWIVTLPDGSRKLYEDDDFTRIFVALEEPDEEAF